MLLALYCLPLAGKFLAVTSLGYAANVAPSSATRWQKLLLGRDLIKRGPDIVGRSTTARSALTDKGRMLMERYLIRFFYCRKRPEWTHELTSVGCNEAVQTREADTIVSRRLGWPVRVKSGTRCSIGHLR